MSARPALLREELRVNESHKEPIIPAIPIIIDEIQKLPVLLDEIHALIEEEGLIFIMTGSSPRKLRRGGYNLLGGRARTRKLFPLVYPEFDSFNLEHILKRGALASIYFSRSPDDDLKNYCGMYLQEKVMAEGAVRKNRKFLPFFGNSRFLECRTCKF